MTAELLGGRYQVLGQVGEGGFGVVHRAIDFATGTNVAIKFLHRASASDLERFRREARVLRAIAGLYVVAVLDADFDHARPYLVMEFCAKGSMRSWVGKERSARDVATLIRHAALGLVELHQQGGFHRDVKPDNILLSINADGRVSAKVGDFGIARMPTRSTTLMTWSAMGTKGYIAPELFAGQPVSWASDVYSLGITLREVLTGTTEVLSPRALRVPFELTSVIARMTHVAAGFRPSMAEVAVELHRFICGWALPAAPPVSLPVAAPAPPRPLAPMARAAVAPAAGGALAVAGLAALGLWFFGSDAKWDSSVGQYRGPDGRFT